MGGCVSIHHQKEASSKTQVDDKLTILMDGHVAVKPQLPPSTSQSPPAAFSDYYGSKEETFFDSQAWLDSDYEDEFMSVNGDFTPSRGNTPVHHSLTPKFNTPLEPSPTPSEKRMRLLDFFKQSLREKLDSNEEADEPPKKDGGLNPKTSMHGCFSTMLYVRGSGRQKKKSPIPLVGL